MSINISYYELPKFGIQPLTSEACAYGMRILCDLSEEGIALVASFLGLQHVELKDRTLRTFPPPMNSRVDDKPAAASCMLDRDVFPRLMLFALWRAGAQTIVQHAERSFTGIMGPADPEYKYLQEYLRKGSAWCAKAGVVIHRDPRVPGQSAVGGRNVHAFTGRTL